jgi:hypothetical protein
MAQLVRPRILPGRLSRQLSFTFIDGFSSPSALQNVCRSEQGLGKEETNGDPAYVLSDLCGSKEAENPRDEPPKFPILNQILRKQSLIFKSNSVTPQQSTYPSTPDGYSLQSAIGAVFRNINILTTNIYYLAKEDVNVRFDQMRTQLAQIRETLPGTMSSQRSCQFWPPCGRSYLFRMLFAPHLA